MVQISRRKHLTLALNIILSVLILSVSPSLQAFAAGKKTIAAVMHSDLRIIDPLFTTAYITRDHGYMVYDTLLAEDANFRIQPQMGTGKSLTTSSPTPSRFATG